MSVIHVSNFLTHFHGKQTRKQLSLNSRIARMANGEGITTSLREVSSTEYVKGGPCKDYCLRYKGTQ